MSGPGGPRSNDRHQGNAMIEIHHLNNSRSQRILWLLEELGQPYKVVPYQRDATTRLAPPELKQVHPLGKSPVIVDDGRVVAETGAIIEYLVRKYDDGKLAPAVDPDSADYRAWLHWMHFVEGSAMLPLMLKLYVGRLGDAGKPLWPRIDSELNDHFVANRFSAADIHLSFILDAGAARGPLSGYPRLTALHARLKARPAYQRAIERGGPYELGR